MEDIRLTEDIDSVDFKTVHEWLTGSYWSPGVTREKVEKAAHYSAIVLSAFVGDVQVGYLRVVSDRTRFGYFCDVFVAESARGRGLAKRVVRHCLEHPDFSDVSRWILATRDAHEVYEACGFGPLTHADRWMLRVTQEDVLTS